MPVQRRLEGGTVPVLIWTKDVERPTIDQPRNIGAVGLVIAALDEGPGS